MAEYHLEQKPTVEDMMREVSTRIHWNGKNTHSSDARGTASWEHHAYSTWILQGFTTPTYTPKIWPVEVLVDCGDRNQTKKDKMEASGWRIVPFVAKGPVHYSSYLEHMSRPPQLT